MCHILISTKYCYLCRLIYSPTTTVKILKLQMYKIFQVVFCNHTQPLPVPTKKLRSPFLNFMISKCYISAFGLILLLLVLFDFHSIIPWTSIQSVIYINSLFLLLSSILLYVYTSMQIFSTILYLVSLSFSHRLPQSKNFLFY